MKYIKIFIWLGVSFFSSQIATSAHSYLSTCSRIENDDNLNNEAERGEKVRSEVNISASEFFALKDFYETIPDNKKSLLNWQFDGNTTYNISGWKGVSARREYPSDPWYVYKIYFWDVPPLSATIPSSINGLYKLEELLVAFEDLQGPLPAELGQISTLKRINLTSNPNLNSVIPPEIGNLSKLEEFTAYNAGLKGTIPPEIGQLKNLKLLNLNGNPELGGAIPSAISGMESLEHLSLGSCNFTSLPSSINNLHNLNILNIGDNNEAIATLPNELWQMNQLEVLHIHSLPIYTLPDAIGGLTSLNFLLATNCQLTQLPETLLNLQNLSSIAVSDNSLTFEDLIPFSSISSNFTYYDQAIVGEEFTIQLPCNNDPLVLELEVDADVTSNTIYWYKVGENPHKATGKTFQVNEPGQYYYKIANSIFNKNTIDSKIKTILPRGSSLTSTQVLQITAQKYTNDRILSVSAATYSDNWDENSTGIYRPSGSYIYNTERSVEKDILKNVNLSEDGVFGMHMFNWQTVTSKSLQQAPKWLKANTITEYNHKGYELENKNAIGQYSAAIYGYDEQLATAVGVNSRYREMAFTGFEDNNDGNFTIHPLSFSLKKKIEVLGGRGNNLIIDYPHHLIDQIKESSFMVNGKKLNGDYKEICVDQLQIGCIYEYPNDDASKTMITLQGLENYISASDVWEGSLTYTVQISSTNDFSVYSTDKKYAHTGTKSLEVVSSQHYEQYKLQLEKDKEYILSAWVSVGEQIGSAPDMGQDLGMKVGFGADGTENVVIMEPKGPVIEGWQRIEGKFTQADDGKVHIFFEPGTNAKAWFDDIRLFPADGNMQSYVYDPNNYQLKATLDNNNFASYYYYDTEGKLYLVKKETIDGIKTLQESVYHQIKTDTN